MMKNFLQTQTAPPPPEPHAASDELRQLRERLAELEARMQKPGSPKTSAKRKPAKKAVKKAAKKRL